MASSIWIGIDLRRRQTLRQLETAARSAGARGCGRADPACRRISATRIRRGRLQFLLAGEGQHALGQRRPAPGTLERTGESEGAGLFSSSRKRLLQQVEIAHRGHQQIVEVMRDAAGELADRLHLLRLAQLLLRPLARRDLDRSSAVRCSTRCSRVAVSSASAVRSFASCSSRFSRSRSAGLRAVISEVTPTRRSGSPIRSGASCARPHVDPVLDAVRPDVAMFDRCNRCRFSSSSPAPPSAPRTILRMHVFQKIVIGEGSPGLAAEMRPAGVRSIEFDIPRMEFQAPRLPAPKAVCSRFSLSVKISRIARVWYWRRRARTRSRRR